MEIRCERCATVYELGESRIPDDGLAVRCTCCDHVFRAFRFLSCGGSDSWAVRHADGRLNVCRDLATLQRWVIDRRVKRSDELFVGGVLWRRLGEMTELLPFFAAVEAVRPQVTRAVAARFPAGGFAMIPNVVASVGQGGPSPSRGVSRHRSYVSILLFAILLVVGAVLVSDRFWPTSDALALELVRDGYVELRRDSYAAMARARSLFEQAEARDPRCVEASLGIAQVDLNRAEYLEARQRESEELAAAAFARAKTALQAGEVVPAAYVVMADYYRIMGAPKDMEALLARARSVAPGDLGIMYVSGAALAASEDEAKRARARDHLDALLEADPAWQRARYALARLYAMSGEPDTALELCRAILREVPDHERSRSLVKSLSKPSRTVNEDLISQGSLSR